MTTTTRRGALGVCITVRGLSILRLTPTDLCMAGRSGRRTVMHRQPVTGTTTATCARTTMLSSTIRSTTTVSTTIRIFDQAEREVRSLPHAHHPATGRGNPHTCLLY